MNISIYLTLTAADGSPAWTAMSIASLSCDDHGDIDDEDIN